MKVNGNELQKWQNVVTATYALFCKSSKAIGLELYERKYDFTFNYSYASHYNCSVMVQRAVLWFYELT